MKRGMSFGASWLFMTAILFSGPTISAQDVSPPHEIERELAQIRELVVYANYRDALSAVQRFLDRPALRAHVRNAGLELLAIVYLALRDERRAGAALADLYARDPTHRLEDPDASPLVQSAFARAREAAQPLTVRITHETPMITRRESPRITAEVNDGGANIVHELRVTYRDTTTSQWMTLMLPLENHRTSGSLPLANGDAAYSVEYYIEAIAPSSYVLAGRGSRDMPLRLDVPGVAFSSSAPSDVTVENSPVESENILEEPWLWVVVGALAIGTGVGIGVGVHYGTQGPQSGSLGEVTLPLFSF
jgi:hypothetical protein